MAFPGHQDLSFFSCLQHSRGSRPEGAGALARAARGLAPGHGRRPSPGQRRTPGRPAESPGQPPYPRLSAHLEGKWSLWPVGGLGRPRRPGAGEKEVERQKARCLFGCPCALQVGRFFTTATRTKERREHGPEEATT